MRPLVNDAGWFVSMLPITSFPRALAALAPWPRRAAALISGAASVLAMAPFHLWPILFLTLPCLVWLLDAAVARPQPNPARAAAVVGWLFGFGFFLAGTFWIGEAFLVEAEKFAALMPFAVMAMPAGLALFWAAAAAVAARAWSPGWRRIAVLALALSFAEWLRGHVLTGFPWNTLGYALAAPDVLMQSAAVLGIYGLTLVAVIVAAAPLVIWSDAKANAAGGIIPAPAGALLAATALTAMWTWGTLRLASELPPHSPTVRLRLVQPSIPQREKWQSENQRRNFERHLELTGRNPQGVRDDAQGIALVVWPEAALPFRPLEIPQALEAIGRVVPDGGHLVSGILRVETPVPPQTQRRALNSLAVFDPLGRPILVYDKIHLVPFGEYLPFQSALESVGLEQLSRMRGGFDSGPSPRPTLRIPGLPGMVPLICYEVIFPGEIIQTASRPAALLNLTNDGWFGNTTGPRQHLHQAQVRAVEQGLPVVRSANNGISAVIDARGRVIARLDLDHVGTLDADLPAALPPPVYARWHDLVFAAIWFASLALLLLSPAHRLTTRPKPRQQS